MRDTTLETITPERKNAIFQEYEQIVKGHLREQADTLQSENPVEIFFRIISQRYAAKTVTIRGLDDHSVKEHGRVIGQVTKNSVMIFPDIAYGVLMDHFRSVGQRILFSRNSLRDALSKEGLIRRSKPGRWSTQFRGKDNLRHQAWEFEKLAFQNRVNI